ncbi:hypothetical protein HOY82DRAFT_577146 [Tuber indicum]|nr:hypothetical protein HOY82DRAFT_577146 [Tuber indicum]
MFPQYENSAADNAPLCFSFTSTIQLQYQRKGAKNRSTSCTHGSLPPCCIPRAPGCKTRSTPQLCRGAVYYKYSLLLFSRC